MYEPLITLVGNVAFPPRLRALAGGTVVADFRVGNTPRRLDKGSDAWADLETTWFGVTCWRALAENCAASLRKGDRVVVTGRLTTRTWESKEGEKRTSLEVEATSVGLDLSRGTATLQRTEREPSRPTTAEEAWATPGVDPFGEHGSSDAPTAAEAAPQRAATAA